MPPPTNPDGSLREFTPAEVVSFELQSRGIDTGAHPTYARSMNSSTVRAMYHCNPLKFEDVCAYFLGAAAVYHDSSTGVDRLSRLMPQTWPDNPHLAATQLISATGFKFIEDDPDIDKFPVPTHGRAEIEFLFEVVPFDLYSDTELEVSPEFKRYTQRLPTESNADYLTLPGSAMKYVTPDGAKPHGTPVPTNIGFITPTSIITRKWHRLPRAAWLEGTPLWLRFYGDPDSGQLPYIGSLNKEGIFKMPPGTLLLLAPSEEINYDPITQEFVTSLVMKWQHKPQGHNFLPFFDPSGAVSASYYAVSNDGVYRPPGSMVDGKSLFPERSHFDLFEVG